MNLPDPCVKCAPFEGAWQEISETAERPGGLKRCDCPRGKALQSKPPESSPRLPTISAEECVLLADAMAAMMFYPPDMAARAMIASEIGAMCNSEAEARWLVREMVRRYQKWPGVIEMRALHCSHAKPRDGEEAISPQVEADHERQFAAISAPPALQIAAGEPVSASPSFAATLSDLVRAKDLNGKLRKPRPGEVREIPVLKLTDANRVTEADVKAAERAVRDQKAREAIG